MMFSRMSYARWFDEALFAAEVDLYSDAWKMPPSFLKGDSSVVARLVKLNYTEGIHDLNVMVMYYLGIMFRIAAYVGLIAFNRDKRSLPSFFDMIVEDILTPVKEIIVDLTLLRGGRGVTGLGASVRRGLGVSDEELVRRISENGDDARAMETLGDIEQSELRRDVEASSSVNAV